MLRVTTDVWLLWADNGGNGVLRCHYMAIRLGRKPLDLCLEYYLRLPCARRKGAMADTGTSSSIDFNGWPNWPRFYGVGIKDSGCCRIWTPRDCVFWTKATSTTSNCINHHISLWRLEQRVPWEQQPEVNTSNNRYSQTIKHSVSRFSLLSLQKTKRGIRSKTTKTSARIIPSNSVFSILQKLAVIKIQ